MKTSKDERDNYRRAFGFPSDFASMEYRLLDDADQCAALEAENERLRRVVEAARRVSVNARDIEGDYRVAFGRMMDLRAALAALDRKETP